MNYAFVWVIPAVFVQGYKKVFVSYFLFKYDFFKNIYLLF